MTRLLDRRYRNHYFQYVSVLILIQRARSLQAGTVIPQSCLLWHPENYRLSKVKAALNHGLDMIYQNPQGASI